MHTIALLHAIRDRECHEDSPRNTSTLSATARSPSSTPSATASATRTTVTCWLSRRNDLLPEQYKKCTQEQQDQSLCVLPSTELQQIVDHSPGEPVYTWFMQRDVLKDGKNTEVAVAVQHPVTEHKFRNIIHTARMFCKYIMPQKIPFYTESKKHLAIEFHTDGEAHNLREVHDNLPHAGWDRCVDVPYHIVSSDEVLFMT